MLGRRSKPHCMNSAESGCWVWRRTEGRARRQFVGPKQNLKRFLPSRKSLCLQGFDPLCLAGNSVTEGLSESRKERKMDVTVTESSNCMMVAKGSNTTPCLLNRNCRILRVVCRIFLRKIYKTATEVYHYKVTGNKFLQLLTQCSSGSRVYTCYLY